MISKKSLICLIIAVAIIGVGIYFALTLDTSKQVDNNSFNEEFITIYENKVETLKEINVKLENEEFTFVRKDEEYVNKKTPKSQLVSATVNSLASDVATFVVKDIITEIATDISQYGLDKPKAIITSVFDNETIKFSVGGQTTGGAYFAKIDGDDRIFTLYKTRGDSLLRSYKNYIDLEVLKVNGQGLLKVYINGDNGNIYLDKKDEKWYVTSPVEKLVNSETINDDIFSRIGYFLADDFIDGANQNLAKYGLANPKKSIYVEDEYGTKQTFYFGNAENGICYVRTDDIYGVFTMSDSALKIFDKKAIDLVETFVNLPHITEVNKITVNANGKVYTLEYFKADDKPEFKINGNDAGEIDYKSMYKYVIGITMTDFCTTQHSISPYCTIEFSYNDKTTRKFEYTPISDRQLVVSENGKCFGYVQKKSVDDLIENIKK